MDATALLESIAGLLLLFVLPGFTTARALFPEWRLAGPRSLRPLVETAVLSFVLSVVLTVLVGYALLAAAPGGFRASWSDPLLEAVLAAVTVIAFVVGLVRGGYPVHGGRATASAGPEEPDPWELTRTLDRLRRAQELEEERAADEPASRRRIEGLRTERERLRREQEERYAR